MCWVKISLLGIHLKVAAALIQRLESAQCTAHLNGVLAQVQARFCIDSNGWEYDWENAELSKCYEIRGRRRPKG